MSYKYLEDRYNSFSERGQEELREAFAPTIGEKMGHAMEETPFLHEQAWRLIRSGGDRETLDREKREREEVLNTRYSHLTEEDRNSGAAIAGIFAKALIDPSYWAAGIWAAPAKLTSMAGMSGRLARGGFEASKWGAVTGASSAIHQAVEEEKIDPTTVAMHTLMGFGFAGPLGMLKGARPSMPSSTAAAAEQAEKAAAAGQRVRKTVTEEPLLPEKVRRHSVIIEKFTPKRGTSGWKILQDVPLNSVVVHEATEAVAAFRIASNLAAAAKKSKTKPLGTPTASELKRLEEASKEAKQFLKSDKILEMYGPQVDVSSDIAIRVAEEASRQGLIDPASLSYLITRPIVGGAAGYGIGYTTKLVTGDEDSMSPWFWMGVGLAGGAFSSKLRTANLSPAARKTAEESVQALLKNNLRGQIAMLTAGTTSAANNVLGGWAAKLNRTFSYQFGPGLKGPAVPGLEQRNAAILDELTSSLLSVGTKWGIGGLGDDALAIRRAVWNHAEGMVGTRTKNGGHTLGSIKKDTELQTVLANNASKGMTPKSLLRTIRGAADDYILLEKQFGEELFRVAPWAKPLPGRVFSQKWNIVKIQENPQEAKKALTRAYEIQRTAELALEGKVPTAHLLVAQKVKAERHIDNIMAHGNVSDPILPKSGRVDRAKRELNESMWTAKGTINPRPLIKNLERDRTLHVFEARKEFKNFLEQDVQTLFETQAVNTVPVIEFVRTFGRNGEIINAVKRKINSQFRALKRATDSEGNSVVSAKDLPKLVKLEQQQHKAIENMVDLYFKRYHIDSPLASSNIAHNIAGIGVTMANTSMLPKVSISSLGDLILPFQNSGSANFIRGIRTTLSDRDYAKALDFGARDPAIAEFSALTSRTSNPASLTQSAIQKINERFFQMIGLGRLTRFSRRQAFNTGVYNTFDVAKRMLQEPSRSMIRRANALGLNDDYINTLNKFDTVDDAMKNEKARRILAIGGRMDADHNSLIPSTFNRRAFTQSNNPLVRSLGQFLSWAQAKTSQTNALVSRIEDGDTALAVRMIGALVLYDGILTFRDILNDPKGTRLEEEGYESRAEKFVSPEQRGRTMQFSANFGPWWADRFSSVMSPYTSRDSLGNISPSLSWFTEAMRVLSPVPYRGLTGSFWRNIGQDDWEGAARQLSYIAPLGKEIADVSDLLGYEIEDKTPAQLENERYKKVYGFAKGGVVEDVPQVPEEPDERIDKMTGLPYNVQAGTAFIDEEDPEKRTELNEGGIAYDASLERLGFGTGAVVKAASTLARSFSKGRQGKVRGPEILTEEKYAARALEQAKQEINYLAASGHIGEDFITTNIQSAPIRNKTYTPAEIDLWRSERIKALEAIGWEKGGVSIPTRIREEIFALGEKANDFSAGKIPLNQYKKALEDYDKLVLEEFAPTVFESVPVPAQALDILSSVRFKKSIPIKERQVIGVNHGIEGGELVALRLDIPAYNSYDTWVVTVHNAKNAKDISGKVRAYASTGHIKDVHFGSDPKTALRIAKGETDKATIARMVGKWQEHDSEDLYRKAIDLLPRANNPKDKEWIQVGMNPYRHSWFYEKTTLRPVKSADEVIQIGGLVLARNPVYSHILHKDYLVRSLGQASKGQAPEVLQHFEKGGIVGEELERLGYAEGGTATDTLELIDLSTLPKRKPWPTLNETMRQGISIADMPENRSMFGEGQKAIDDFRWSEFDRENNKVFINHDKFRDAGAVNYEEEMINAESWHNLSRVAPNVYENLYEKSMNDPVSRQWLEDSYNWHKANAGETREFIPFVRGSRLDQVIGGYFFGSPDSTLPSMQTWNPPEMAGYGTEFRQSLEDFKGILDQPFDSEEDRQTFSRRAGPEYTGTRTFPLPERGQVEVEKLPSIDLTPAINLDEVYAIPEWMAAGANAISDDVGSLITYEESSPTYDRFGGILNYGIDSPQITRQNIKELSDPIQTVLMSQGLNEKGTNQIRTEEDLNEGVHQAFKDAAAVALADGRRGVSFHDYGDTDILLPKERWFDENTPRYLSVAASVGDNVDEYNNPLSPEIRKQYTEDRMSVWPFDPKEITSYSTLPSTIESFKNALNNDPKIKAAWSVGRFAVHGDEGNLYMNDYFNFNTKNQMGKDFYSFVRSVLSNIAGLPIEDSELGVQTRVRLD